MGPIKRFLFLQGLRSPFFSELAQALMAQGHAVDKVHFTVGDHLYGSGPAIRCQARLEHLTDFYGDLLARGSYTDLVLFGDCRPVHQPAIALARSQGLEVHVFEEGYFRPDWITLERGGVNGYSALPKCPDWYRCAAEYLCSASGKATQDTPLSSGFRARVLHDIAYNVASIANRWVYPDYPSHVTYAIRAEYLSYAQRLWRLRARAKRDTDLFHRVCHAQGPRFFLLCLQLRGDSQLRFHSDYADTTTLLQDVLTSFARHARPDAWLVIKNHPLDPGFTDYERVIQTLAQPLGIEKRVHFMERGHLPTLLDHAQAMVTVNSTSISQALFHKCPVKALGDSVFNIPELTHQDTLDTLWQQPHPVDQHLFAAVRRVLMHVTQIHGGLYAHAHRRLAIAQAVPRLLEAQDRLTALQAHVPLQRAPTKPLQEVIAS